MYYYRSANIIVCQSVAKSRIISKLTFLCVWDSGQYLATLKFTSAKGCDLILKLEPVIGRVYFS